MNSFFQELFHAGIYKRSQGRITRQLTCAAIGITVVLGLYRLSKTLEMMDWAKRAREFGFQYWLPGMLLVIGLWIAYRLVNVPAFADFLIAVEAEMNKVSWPGRTELFRASMVVLFTIFFLAAILFGFDIFWKWLFVQFLEIFPRAEPAETAMVGFGLDWTAALTGIPRVA